MTDTAKRTAKPERRTNHNMADHNSEPVLGTPGLPITFMRSLAGFRMVLVRGEMDQGVVNIVHRLGFRISELKPAPHQRLFPDIPRMPGNWTLRLARLAILARLSPSVMREAGIVALSPIVANALRSWKLVCPKSGGDLTPNFGITARHPHGEALEQRRGLMDAWGAHLSGGCPAS
jgi:hypothetical protein